MRQFRYILMMLTIAASTVAAMPTLSAPEPGSTDVMKIKAAFVYNFIKYVQWSDEAFADDKGPLVIGVTGPDDIREALRATLHGESIGNRTMEVVLIVPPEARPDDRRAYAADLTKVAEGISRCHVVFFGEEHARWVGDLQPHFATFEHTLTIGDGDAFVRTPTALDLVKVDGRFVFYANHPTIKQAQYKISSKLLRLARDKK